MLDDRHLNQLAVCYRWSPTLGTLVGQLPWGERLHYPFIRSGPILLPIYLHISLCTNHSAVPVRSLFFVHSVVSQPHSVPINILENSIKCTRVITMECSRELLPSWNHAILVKNILIAEEKFCAHLIFMLAVYVVGECYITVYYVTKRGYQVHTSHSEFK